MQPTPSHTSSELLHVPRPIVSLCLRLNALPPSLPKRHRRRHSHARFSKHSPSPSSRDTAIIKSLVVSLIDRDPRIKAVALRAIVLFLNFRGFKAALIESGVISGLSNVFSCVVPEPEVTFPSSLTPCSPCIRASFSLPPPRSWL